MVKEGYFHNASYSFSTLFKNLIIYIPDLAYYAATAILSIIFLYMNGLNVIFSNIGLFGEQIKTITNSSNLLQRLLVTLGIFVVINLAVGLGMITLRYSLVKQAIEKRKVNLWHAYLEGSKYIWKILGIKIVLTLLYLVPVTIFGAIAYAYRLLIIPMIILIIVSWILLKFALTFAYPILYLKTHKGVFKTIKATFDYFNKKPKHSILTCLFVIIVSAVVGLITSNLVTLNLGLALIITFIVKILIDVTVTLWSSLFLFKSYS